MAKKMVGTFKVVRAYASAVFKLDHIPPPDPINTVPKKVVVLGADSIYLWTHPSVAADYVLDSVVKVTFQVDKPKKAPK